jgi:VWFA-related protein
MHQDSKSPGEHTAILFGCYTQKVTLRAAALWASGFLLSSLMAGAAPPAEPPVSVPPDDRPPQESFTDEISVSLSTVVVRAVDTWGRPILGLEPKDFRVRAGDQEIPVVAVDWIAASEESPGPSAVTTPEAPAAGEPAASAPAAPPPGRLVVVFVQADLNPTRISGQLRLRPFTRELLDSLSPQDRVAVVSFDSHLKLRQDFSRDRAATHAAIDEGMIFNREREVPEESEVSLARGFDFAAARAAASTERGLELTAQALAPLPGEKMMIFLGWGFGRFGADGVHMTPAYYRAVRALGASRTPVFALDVTSADSHSLAAGLGGVAAATGGMYLSSFRLPHLATDILAKAISGYYILTLDPGQLSGVTGRRVTIELRGKRGDVLARPAVVR